MKKKWTIIIPVIIVALICTAFFVYIKSASSPTLSQTEVDKLRVKYPINDKQPAMVELISLSLEEYIQICDCYVEVEILSEPIVYIKTVTSDSNSPDEALREKAGGLTGFNFVKYEVRVIDDVFHNIQQDTIEITYNSDFDIGMPSMDVGSKFIVGGVYNSKNGTIDIGGETMFYVTEDEYVLSVKSEASKNRHSGKKADDFFEYLQTVKEGTE